MKKIDKNQIVTVIQRSNPWWRGGGVGEFKEWPRRAHFPRLYDLVTQENPRRALVLLGPRRVGKTVLIYQIIDELIQQGREPKKILYASLDSPLFRLSSLEEIVISGFEWSEAEPKGGIVFFDEIQYVENWEQQLKVLVDAYPQVKFVATGSAAAALHKKSQESGAGRFSNYLLPPLSFFEYVSMKYRLEKAPFHTIDLHKLNSLYLEYLNYGGFPESLTSEEIRTRPDVYIGQDILDKVLARDLPSLFGITNPNELNRLFTALAYNTSHEVSPEDISKGAGVPKAEVNRYIEFLEAAFLIRVIEKTDDKIQNFQRRRLFKIVLANPSLRSAIFGPVKEGDQELESLAETAVFSQLIIYNSHRTPLHKYARWNRGGSKGEVDLVHIDLKSKAKAALEIKWSDRFAEYKEKPSSLIAFCKENQLKHGYMTTKTLFSKTQHGDVEILHVPTSYLCFLLGMAGTLKNAIDDIAEDVSLALSEKTKEAAVLKDELSKIHSKRLAGALEGLFYIKEDLMKDHYEQTYSIVKELLPE